MQQVFKRKSQQEGQKRGLCEVQGLQAGELGSSGQKWRPLGQMCHFLGPGPNMFTAFFCSGRSARTYSSACRILMTP